MNGKNREWPDPEPSIPLYYYPKLAIPLLFAGIIIQYSWLQFVLPVFGFNTILTTEMANIINWISQSMESGMELILASPDGSRTRISVAGFLGDFVAFLEVFADGIVITVTALALIAFCLLPLLFTIELLQIPRSTFYFN